MIQLLPNSERPNRISIILMVCLLSGTYCGGQNIVNIRSNDENIFLIRTKQFSEFVDRFNYKTDFWGNPIDSVFEKKFPRGKMISSLFDFKDKRTLPESETYSKHYVESKNSFINDVVENDLEIDRFSSEIIAEANSRILFRGNPYTISIFLKQEKVEREGVKWVIEDVKGNIFNFLEKDTTLVRFIPPGSNETDFINLKRALNDVDHLQYYASKDFAPDRLTAFFFCLHTHILTFEYVENIIYHINEIPGWCFKVEELNRNEMNSGWLITDLSEAGNL